MTTKLERQSPMRAGGVALVAAAVGLGGVLLAAGPAMAAVTDATVLLQQGTPPQGAQQPAQDPQDPVAGAPTQTGSGEIVLTAEEEAAMRLIRQILEDEEGVRMGRDDYDPEGRRDPFRSLIAVPGADGGEGGDVRPPGLPGMLISEVNIKAIARFQGQWAVLLEGNDQRTYPAAVGTELWDGHVKEIRQNEVVFEAQVTDALGARRTREVIKQLRTTGGGSESRP